MTGMPKAMTAAALLAAAAFAGALSAPARAADLPACSAAVRDHCIQMGGEAMAPSPQVKAAQEANVQAVEDKASEAGHAVVKGAKAAGEKAEQWGREAKEKVQEMINGEGSESSAEKPGAGEPSDSGAIPHGCSPATTPCE